jgi:hypothetical protein
LLFLPLGRLFGPLGRVGEVGENVARANKIRHIFGPARHGLGEVVSHFGSEEAAFQALERATQQAVQSQGLKGIFETTVKLGGTDVTVRGSVIDGIARIGTAFVP